MLLPRSKSVPELALFNNPVGQLSLDNLDNDQVSSDEDEQEENDQELRKTVTFDI